MKNLSATITISARQIQDAGRFGRRYARKKRQAKKNRKNFGRDLLKWILRREVKALHEFGEDIKKRTRVLFT